MHASLSPRLQLRRFVRAFESLQLLLLYYFFFRGNEVTLAPLEFVECSDAVLFELSRRPFIFRNESFRVIYLS